MRKSYGILLILMVFTWTGMAQEKSKSANQETLMFYATGGVHYMDLNNLNSLLGKYNLPEVNALQGSYGFGTAIHDGRWLIGGEGFQFSSESQSSGNQVNASGSMGYFYLGYYLVDGAKFHLYPRLGVGGSGMNISIHTPSNGSLSDLLQNPTSSVVNTGGALNHFSVNLGWSPAKFFSLDASMGYNLAWSNAWEAKRGNLIESTEDGIGGAFIHMNAVFMLHVEE